MADGGTLFIDEIGELAGSLQAKLLRVLEDGSMRRVGSLKERRVDVRLLAATNRNMENEVAEGPLSRGSVLPHQRHVVAAAAAARAPRRHSAAGAAIRRATDWTVEPAAMQALERYRWPGNVRQLFNALERAQIMADEASHPPEDLPREIAAAPVARPAAEAHEVEGEHLADIQRAHILDVLRRERGNKARTARALGVNRRSLYRLLEKYEIHLGENGGEPRTSVSVPIGE